VGGVAILIKKDGRNLATKKFLGCGRDPEPERGPLAGEGGVLGKAIHGERVPKGLAGFNTN